ncbi:sensory neuron membrane protein 1-like [Chelonus insularis]|uniref:sensory neuron membrane protein 1-like n=1 Tax=Chelonus insularis TaxID=460826 RepID=UPI00158CC535|nr:sensory neuron membrane protein 1-like [Chelonus insularis]
MLLHMKVGIAGSILFFLGFLLFSAFPPFLKSQVKKAVRLKKGEDIRDMWEKTPFPLDFRIYLFNITNADQIKTGAKPIVQEVGPFFYDEWKEKVDCDDNDADDTVEYSNKATWIFNPGKSAPGLTEDVELVLPHIMILGMILTTVREKPGMVGLAAKAIDSIFHKPDSIFIKTTARQILWDGLPVDCSVKDFAGSAVCSLLREDDSALIKDGENYRFALFGHKNGTVIPDRIKVKRGIKNYLDVGVVTEFKGEPKLSVWSEEGTCNEFNGTDSTIFHAYLYSNEDVVSFTPDLCRSLSTRYQRPTKIKGIKTNRYSADLGDMSSDPEIKCLCPAPDKCLKKGLFDLYPCIKAPIIATLPHFYLTAEEYLTQVDGLNPMEEKHQIFLDFEPITATPLAAGKRLQFNMMIFPIEKFKLMKTFPTALLPLFWVEEGLVLGDEYVKQLKGVFKVFTIIKIMKYLFLTLGVGLCGAAGGLYYKFQQSAQKLDITKITPKAAPNTNGQEKKWPTSVSTIQTPTAPPTVDA